MKIKSTLLALFLLVSLSNSSMAQRDSFVPHSLNVYTDVIVNTVYKNPMVGIMGELEVPVGRSKVDIVLRPGLWINPTVPNNNFLVLQMGVNVKINSNLKIGTYFMNKQSFLPRPHYKTQNEAVNEGYNSPFSLFATITPFKTDKIYMKTEYMYFIRYNIRKEGWVMNKSACMITIGYKLINHNAIKK